MGPKEDREFIDSLQIAVCSYTYRLRMALALMTEHNTQLGVSRETLYVTTLLNDMLEASEDAQATILSFQSRRAEEARLGEDEL